MPVALRVGGEAAEVAVGAEVKDRGDAAAVDGDADAGGGAGKGVEGEAPRVGVLVGVGGRWGRGHVGEDAGGAIVLFELGDDLDWHAVLRNSGVIDRSVSLFFFFSIHSTV